MYNAPVRTVTIRGRTAMFAPGKARRTRPGTVCTKSVRPWQAKLRWEPVNAKRALALPVGWDIYSSQQFVRSKQ